MFKTNKTTPFLRGQLIKSIQGIILGVQVLLERLEVVVQFDLPYAQLITQRLGDTKLGQMDVLDVAVGKVPGKLCPRKSPLTAYGIASNIHNHLDFMFTEFVEKRLGIVSGISRRQQLLLCHGRDLPVGDSLIR